MNNIDIIKQLDECKDVVKKDLGDNIKVTSISEINNVKNHYEIGDEFTLKVYRNNKQIIYK